jgi:pimeloyl-ACP methyl ester carboxylesterase
MSDIKHKLAPRSLITNIVSKEKFLCGNKLVFGVKGGKNMAELISVHKPTTATGKPHLVFIHGLDGDIRKTWMVDPEDSEMLWPKWVGEKTACPVWLLGYQAAMTRWQSGSMALPRQATAVIERLSNEPELMEGPLILIGHSLGGLVIKTALQHGMSGGVDRHARIARNIKGIAFVGTPHFGSKLASFVAWSHFMRANPQMNDLRLNNANLETLNQYFLKLRGELNFKTRIFIETQPVRLPCWLGGRWLPGVTIVSSMSSQGHIPGEVGIPIEANHITICKPKDQNAAIHTSLVAFVREVEAANSPTAQIDTALTSESVEALSPGQRTDTKVHLAFSMSCDSSDSDAGVCTSVCLVTDAPDRLRQQIQSVWKQIQQDPLVNAATKKRLQGSSLRILLADPGTRAVVLRALAVMSFSAYLYYCSKGALNKLSQEERVLKLITVPLVHRLSKKGERFKQVHDRLSDMPIYLAQAADEVRSSYHRTVVVPTHGDRKYSVLEELASLIAQVCSGHLAAPESAESGDLFESLRTRIRYAENVDTGEKHTRDKNPLP